MESELTGCIALGVEVAGTKRFTGIVGAIEDKICKISTRGVPELERGTYVRLLFRIHAGQVTADACVAQCNETQLMLVLVTPLVKFHERASQRREVRSVTASCQLESVEVKLRVLDISEGGFRFETDIPLPMEQEIQFELTFDQRTYTATAVIVRLNKQTQGCWAGGAKLCISSRIELARLRQEILEAA